MPPKETNPTFYLLSRAHSPDTAQQIYTKKLSTRPLHLKPTLTSNAQDKRRLERERKLASRKKALKPKPLSSRQRRALCLYDIPPKAQKYSIYGGLHQLWQGYMREVLCGVNNIGEGEKAKLCSADYHGAEVEVVRSRCVSRVGVKGIVVKDSKFTFEIVTRRDVVKIVPKEGTIFRFTTAVDGGAPVEEQKQEKEVLKDFVFELHGDQFTLRAADRAGKKFKPHYLRDI
ncbi:Rof/RNase P-like protein [Calycina marina]|uniref:Ribonuclease P protein subunit n=1 Tax=Calycina marina TaxID=1763456 RepID=A0A9P8CEM8_9HELO|nr:Rof/RNase P-like protein [Calycina marina]